MSWTTSAESPETQTRRLDTVERFFQIVSASGAALQRTHWAVSVSLALRFPPSVPDPAPFVWRAWLLLRRLHPQIGAIASPPSLPEEGKEDQGPTITVGPLDPEKWLAETFAVNTSVPDANALFQGLDYPVATATCHWLPRSSEVVLHSAHWRIDGIGMMMLSHSFMTILASLLAKGPTSEFDPSDPNLAGKGSLSLGIDSVVDGYLSEEATPPRLRDAVDNYLGRFLQGLPSVGLPTAPGSETAIPGPTSRVAVSLTEAETRAVVSRCKALNVSVTAAIYASIARASVAYPQDARSGKSFAALAAQDLRRYMGPPWNTPEYAVSLYMSGVPICVHGVADLSWVEVAREIAAAYRIDPTRWDPGDGGEPVNLLPLVATYVRRTTKMYSTPPPPEMPPPQTPELSSLGVVEDHLRREYAFTGPDGREAKVEVSNFWMADSTLARSLFCHLWTFRDQLHLAACFNQSFYEPDFALKFLEAAKEELLQGLDVRV